MLLIVPHLHQGPYDSFRLAIGLRCCRARELLPNTISHAQLRKSVMLRIPLKFFAVIRIGCLYRIGAFLQDLTQKAPGRSGCLVRQDGRIELCAEIGRASCRERV